MTIDRDELLARVDILALIERDLGPAQRHSGRWWFFRCPFHGAGNERTASLGVTPDTRTYHCYGCGAQGTVIDWVMRRGNRSFVEACQELGAMDLPAASQLVNSSRDTAIRSNPPGEPWQSKALDWVETCKDRLWNHPSGVRALDYLHSRGMTNDTIWEWRLGFQDTEAFQDLSEWGIEQPDDGKRHAMWLPRGVTIPAFDPHGGLYYVKVRRSAADINPQNPAKYIKLKVPAGCSASGLFGEDHLSQRAVMVVEEGEFNALTIYQEAGDLVDVVSTGTSSTRPETLEPWWGHFLMANHILLRFDLDQAGEKGTEQWRALTRRARKIRVPQGGDPNEFLAKHGGNIRAWIELELTKLSLEDR